MSDIYDEIAARLHAREVAYAATLPAPVVWRHHGLTGDYVDDGLLHLGVVEFDRAAKRCPRCAVEEL